LPSFGPMKQKFARANRWTHSRGAAFHWMTCAAIASLVLVQGCDDSSSDAAAAGGTSGIGGEHAVAGTTGIGGEHAAGSPAGLGGNNSGIGGNQAGGATGTTGPATNPCNCLRGAYGPACGVDGKTYDATCGDICVPVAIACRRVCPCESAGAGGTGGQGSSTSTTTGKAVGQDCAAASECATGLLCCYPCGTGGCPYQCTQPLSSGVCPMYP